MDERRFSSTKQEAETNCRGCGYNTTDEERAFYGQYQYDDEKSTKRHRHIIRQYHFCTFCVEDAAYRHRFFKNLDYKIHQAKVRLRDKTLKSTGYLFLVVSKNQLEFAHYDEIHNAPYKVDDLDNRVYNQYESDFMLLEKSISEYRFQPRHLYLEALENFGGESDEPPCTRNLTVRQKKMLLKKLKSL